MENKLCDELIANLKNMLNEYGYKFRGKISNNNVSYFEFFVDETIYLYVIRLSDSVMSYDSFIEHYKDEMYLPDKIMFFDISILSLLRNGNVDYYTNYPKNYKRFIYTVEEDDKGVWNSIISLIASVAADYDIECDLEVGDIVRNEADGKVYEIKGITKVYDPYTYSGVTILTVPSHKYNEDIGLRYTNKITKIMINNNKEEKFECDLKVGDTVRNETDGKLYEVKKIVRVYEPFTFARIVMLKVKPKGFDCELYFEYTPNITKVVDE